MEYRFIPNHFEDFKNICKDDLNFIEERAQFLFELMNHKDWNSFPIQNDLFHYFKDRHLGNRLEYSIKSSVSILLIAINESNKKSLFDLKILDYGAGFSTVFLLSSLLKINTYVNDLFDSFENNIIALYHFLDMATTPIYICGEAKDVVHFCTVKNLKLDVILSRNVIEHIYDYKAHLETVKQIPFEEKLTIIDSTTANYANPLVFLQHKIIHLQNTESVDIQRKKYIKEYLTTITDTELNFLTKKLRTLAKEELNNQLELYKSNGKITHKTKIGNTNICEPQYGCWTERLEKFSFYRQIFNDLNIEFKYNSGQWITNYSFLGINYLFHLINKITTLLPTRLKIITGPTLILIGTIKSKNK